MSDLVPDHPPPHPLASVPDGLSWPEAREWVKAKRPETYRGPYGEYPVRMQTGGLASRAALEQIRDPYPQANRLPSPGHDNSDPGDEQPEPRAGLMRRTGFSAPADSEYDDSPKWTDAIGMIRDRIDSAEIAAHKIAALEAILDRTNTVLESVRAANEQLRRERVEVEAALGHLVHAGQLGPAVKMALYRAQ